MRTGLWVGALAGVVNMILSIVVPVGFISHATELGAVIMSLLLAFCFGLLFHGAQMVTGGHRK